MYLIVLFEEENKTGPVAKEWFSDGLAWWPPYSDQCQILRSVQKKVVPNPSKGWRQFAARVLYESDSINKIQEKWERSCVTSDLNTDKEHDITTVRQRRKPKRLRSPSPSSTSSPPSMEDDNLATLQENRPPKTQKRVNRLPSRNLTAPPPLPVVSRPKSTDAIRAVISQGQPVSSNSDSCPDPAWQLRNMDCSQLISQARPVSSNSDLWQPSNMDSSQRMTSNLRQESEVRLETDCHQRPSYTELTTVSWRPNEAHHPTPWPDDGLGFPEHQRYSLHDAHQRMPTTCTAVERIILEQIGELNIKVDHLTAIVQSLSQNRAQEQQPQRNDFDHLFPISTLHELNCFDERLLRDVDFKKHVIGKLSRTGGNSVKKTVWRVCRKVFSPEIATQLNWCGRGEKTGIKSRPVHEVLLLSVLRNGALTHITEAEIETAIQNWLRLSKDRLGGQRRQRPQL